jgi:uncharacterized cupin superfamily protein
VVLVVGGVVVVGDDVGVELDVGVDAALELLPLEPQPAAAATSRAATPASAADLTLIDLMVFSFIAFPEYPFPPRSGSIPAMKRSNVFDDEFEFDEADPEGYRCAVARVGKTAGGEALAVKAYELPPGETLCPYHYEYEEEWLLVLDGTIVVRTPDGEEEAGRGDLMAFPPGPAGAHKALNRSEETARILMWSSAREPAVAVYPDSDKIGVWPGRQEDHVMLRRADGGVDYYDGEQ